MIEEYVKKLFRSAQEEPLFECPVCGCTHGAGTQKCSECWSRRLVRIE